MQRAPLSLRARAIALLARRDHSRAELRRKLLRHLRCRPSDVDADADADAGEAAGAPASAEAEVDALLDWLCARGYLDEARFVETRVHARAPRFGLRRIEAELASSGVPIDAATAAGLRDTELDRARAVRARRFAALPVDATERARQARFLAGRGFAPDVIRRVLRSG